MTRVRRSWWPLGPASVLVPSLAIVAVVVGMTWSMLWWPYPEWVRISAEFHQQFAFAGLIAATSACWYATALHAGDRIWLQPRAVRAGLPAATHHATTLIGWFVSAYLVALVPLVSSTVIRGGVGTQQPLVMLSGVLAMIAVTALGYALGTLVPHTAMVPIVAVGCYALLVGGNAGGERLASVAPMLYFEPSLGELESLPLTVFRSALFVVVAVASVGLAGKSLYRAVTGARRPARSFADAAVYLVLPAVLVTVSLIRQPVVFVADTTTSSCTERRDIRYCVHTENLPRVHDLMRIVDPVIARFGSKPDNIQQIWDYALVYRPYSYPLMDGIELVTFLPDGTIEETVARELGSSFMCSSAENDAQTEPRAQATMQLESDIESFLLTGRPDGSLAGMSVTDVQRWLSRHQKQLHACTLTPDQLPKAQAR